MHFFVGLSLCRQQTFTFSAFIFCRLALFYIADVHYTSVLARHTIGVQYQGSVAQQWLFQAILCTVWYWVLIKVQKLSAAETLERLQSRYHFSTSVTFTYVCCLNFGGTKLSQRAENLQKLHKFSTAKNEHYTVHYMHILHCTLVHNNSILV